MLTPDERAILEAALIGYECRKEQIDTQIEALRLQLNLEPQKGTKRVVYEPIALVRRSHPLKGKKLSVAVRKRMALAQRKRHALARAAGA